MLRIYAEISVGELIDKITILEIKKDKFTNVEKIQYVKEELRLLTEELEQLNVDESGLFFYSLKSELKNVNSKLWEIEDDLRALEKKLREEKNINHKEWNEVFIHKARQVYQLNDKRFELKNELNILFQSHIREQKQHIEY